MFYFFSHYYGNCYRINTGYDTKGNKIDFYKQIAIGKYNGFSLILFSGVFEDEMSSILNLEKSNGVIISIENQTYFPTVRFNGIHLMPGTNTYISLRKTVSKDMPHPYSNCQHANEFKSIFESEFVRYNLTYSQETCMLFCEQKWFYDQCKCLITFIPQIFNANPCSSAVELQCMEKNDVLFDENIECTRLCPPACEVVTYSYSSSYGEFPSKGIYLEKLRNNPFLIEHFARANISYDEITFDRLKSSTLGLDVYFEDKKFTSIEQSPTRLLVDLFSGIGGDLSLFIGMNVLSLFGLVELAIEIFYILKSKNETTKNEITINTQGSLKF